MRLISLIAILLLQSVNALHAKDVVFVGHITDEKNNYLSDVKISINQQAVYTNKRGEFRLLAKQQPVYQFKFSKRGYYTAIQSFSDFELSAQQTSTKQIRSIALVEKIDGRVMLSFGGDVMMGRRFSKPKFNNPVLIHQQSKAQDTKFITRQVKPYLSIADYAAVNLETQISHERLEKKAPKSVVFFSPLETLSALKWAGVDYVTLGNNHTYDFLDEGLISTLDALKRSGLGFSGAGLNEKQALSAHQVTLNKTPFSMLGYVGWEGGFSPNQTAAMNKGGAAFGSEKNIVSGVTKESKQGRAVVVQYHGSQEYESEPTVMTEQRLKSAIDAGADLAIAHHPHVTQGFEVYKGKLIAYSLGNFIFDQYFYATPHSFVLNVWMDGETFHRAEVVPVYLKGYQPTPATGEQRAKLLKRVQTLSRKRGTQVTFSGGHAVILPKSNDSFTERSSELIVEANQQIVELSASHHTQLFNKISSNDKSLSYRVGTRLTNGSTLESFNLYDSAERGWNTDSSHFSLTQLKANSGLSSLTSVISPKGSETLSMTNFARVYNGGNPMTVDLAVNVTGATQVNVYWQGRKKKDKLNDALNKGTKHLIKSFELSDSKGWQRLSASFNSPRVGYRGIRFIAEFRNQLEVDKKVFVDDLSFIQWNSAFTPVGKTPIDNELIPQSALIEFNRPLTESDKVSVKYLELKD